MFVSRGNKDAALAKEACPQCLLVTVKEVWPLNMSVRVKRAWLLSLSFNELCMSSAYI